MEISKKNKVIILNIATAILLLTGVIMYKIKNSTSSEKIAIDLLVQNGIVLTMNPQKEILKDGVLAIHNGKIIDIGSIKKIGQTYKAKKIIDAHNCVVLPGLINAHVHAPMTLFRGLADDLPLMNWLQKYIFPAEKKYVTPDFVYWGTKLACYEMIKGGTTTFVDMYFFEDAVAQAAYDMGMRAIVGETIIGFPTPDSPTYKKAVQYAENFVQKWKNNRLITPAIAPHAPYTCSKEILLATKKFSEIHHVPLLIHLSETKNEIKQILSKYNMRPVAYLDSLGMLNKKMIAAHCVHLDDTEIALLKKRKIGVVHAPTSNMKLSSGIARVYDLIKQGVLVGLGTDGAASNNSLDMFGEMKTATLLQKVATENPAALNAYQTLELATIGGARALHMEKQIGSLEAGKKADVTIVATNKIHQIPVYNVVSQLVYATKASDVQTVIIDGKVIMENRILGTKNEHQKLEQKVAHYKELINSTKQTPNN